MRQAIFPKGRITICYKKSETVLMTIFVYLQARKRCLTNLSPFKVSSLTLPKMLYVRSKRTIIRCKSKAQEDSVTRFLQYSVGPSMNWTGSKPAQDQVICRLPCCRGPRSSTRCARLSNPTTTEKKT